jgi:hypothetical protein
MIYDALLAVSFTAMVLSPCVAAYLAVRNAESNFP